MDNIDLTKEQEDALNLMCSGENIFLTGEAGTGKSTIINKFLSIKSNKNILTFAPTGIAALQISGVTLHRGFHIPINIQDETSRKMAPVPDTILSADIIIIDEISMCRIDVFDYVSNIIFKANKTRAKYFNKKPIQVIVSGDFFQLPPVVTDRDKEALRYLYPKVEEHFAFNSDNWNKFNFKNIVLKEVLRQENKEFISYLNQIRKGENKAISDINTKTNKKVFEDGITLSGINRVAAEINAQKLEELPFEEHIYPIKIVGRVNKGDINCEEILSLKIGARVMTITNHSGGFYQNGSFGTVKDFGKNFISVKLDNGLLVDIEKYTWEILDYTTEYDKEGNKLVKKEVIGKYTQFPLKLAYAITIHKSQGQTFEKVNLIPYAWDDGQLYVALSRATNLNGIHLMQPILPKYLKTSKGVQKFYAKL